MSLIFFVSKTNMNHLVIVLLRDDYDQNRKKIDAKKIKIFVEAFLYHFIFLKTTIMAKL